MSIPIACPKCRTVLNAPDQAAGKKATCSCCGQKLIVPQIASVPGEKPTEKMRGLIARGLNQVSQKVAGSETPLPSAAATMPCPYCGETIVAGAKKCKHCKELLDPALRAEEFEKARMQLEAAQAEKFSHGNWLAASLITGGLTTPLWILQYGRYKKREGERNAQRKNLPPQ